MITESSCARLSKSKIKIKRKERKNDSIESFSDYQSWALEDKKFYKKINELIKDIIPFSFLWNWKAGTFEA